MSVNKEIRSTNLLVFRERARLSPSNGHEVWIRAIVQLSPKDPWPAIDYRATNQSAKRDFCLGSSGYVSHSREVDDHTDSAF